MEIYEITGYQTGVSREGVNFLQPADSFQNIQNGYIYRQVLQSRKGFKKFSTGESGNGHLPTRVMGIFQNIKTSTSTNETIVFDKNFAYKYDEGTNAFVVIPFNARILAADPTFKFNLTDNENYITGTTYPTFDGTNRFVFTGKAMPGVFFYNGTDIGDYTNLTDNPKYQAFSTGDINLAVHIFWFGERLNFVAPTINSVFYPQGMLYSAIRTSTGNGDKYNTAGSGLLQLDTYENIRGAKILGDRIALNVSQSNWIIEKTRDPFNPYFSRKIPSVLGTDASFSSVRWNDEVRSIGRTGIISTDGRQSLRIDTKIPYFTDDEIDVLQFEQTYGGFDRITSQFLWAYVESGSGATTQNKVLVNNYEEKTWSVYDQSFSCFGETTNGQNLTWNDIDENENPAWLEWNTTEETWNKIGIEKQTQKTLAGDNLGFIYELNQDYDDYFVTIIAPGITKASAAVVSTQDQALQIGDKVVFSGVAGMTEINGLEAEITARTISTITVNIDSTEFTAWSSAGSVSKLISFSAETIPFNPFRAQGRKCKISHVEFLIDTNGGSLTVDVFMDGGTSPFKSNVLLKPGKTVTNNVTAIDISGDPAVVITTSSTAGLQNGSIVSFASVGGTTELNGNSYSISALTGTTFTVQQASPSAFTTEGTWTFTQPQIKDREWMSLQINNTADFTVFKMRQETASRQVKLTSMRIHCEVAGLTTD